MSDMQDNTRISEKKVCFNVVCIGSAIRMHVQGFKGGCCITVPCRTLHRAAHARFKVDTNLAKHKACVAFALLASDRVA